MRTNSALRAAGRADLSGRWNEAAMLCFVYVVICGIFSSTTQGLVNMAVNGLGGILGLLLLPMSWGYTMAFVTNHRKEDNDPFDLGCLFSPYHDFVRLLTTGILHYIYILLWSLLLIIPGIVKTLSYAMTPYILKDRPDLKNNCAIELSMAMMYGHKADLFLLYLSFIGWALLCIPTLGIGFFWLDPYISATLANFYEDVKHDFENGGTMNGGFASSTDNYQK